MDYSIVMLVVLATAAVLAVFSYVYEKYKSNIQGAVSSVEVKVEQEVEKTALDLFNDLQKEMTNEQNIITAKKEALTAKQARFKAQQAAVATIQVPPVV